MGRYFFASYMRCGPFLQTGRWNDMAIPGVWCKRFRWSLLLVGAVVLLLAGCAPKVYLSSFSDDHFNSSTVGKLAVVLENSRGQNPLFGEIFMQSALEKRRPFLIHGGYFPQADLSGEDLWKKADAFLMISLAYSHQGTQTPGSPTILGASAKLVETTGEKVVWKMNYAYKSAETGSSAPLIEEAMKIAAEKILDAVPLVKGTASLAGAGKYRKGAKALASKAGVSTGAETAPPPPVAAEVPIPVQSLPVKAPAVKAPPPPPSIAVINAEKEYLKASQAPVGATGFSVQAGAFIMREFAGKRMSLLREKGFSPYVIEKPGSGTRPWYTVQVGRYTTRSEAETAAKTISEKAHIETTLHLLK